jgi:RHS repeat-associated protein
MNKLGISQIGNVISVAEGERYVFRVKGYNGAPANANLYVKGNTTDVLWPGASLPYTAVNESWVEESFTIPTGVTQITLGVIFNSTALATASNVFYINEIEFYKKTSLAPEYQYNLKDHLGNVRLTFTTKTVTQQTKATFESVSQTTEANNFLHYPSGGGLINTQATNAHTGTNSEYLNGGYNGQVGVAKSFAVMPGDQLQIEAYAKYNAPSTTSSNLTGFTTALLGAFNLSAPIVNEAGTASSAINNWGVLEAGGYGDGSTDQSDPRVFVTIITFDKNYNYLDVAYQQLTSSGYMSCSYTVRQPGYAYMYVSNEHPTLIDVYVDDVTMTYTPSAIIASNDYYPFGLTYNSYTRENGVRQDYQYNGKEMQDELNLGWLDYGARMYMNDIGRWGVVDMHSDKFTGLSPYSYVADNPVKLVDPDGKDIMVYYTDFKYDKNGNVKHKRNGQAKTTTRSVKLSIGKNGSIEAKDKKDNDVKNIFVSSVVESLNYTKKGDKNNIIENAIEHRKTLKIRNSQEGDDRFIENNNTIYWHPQSGMYVRDNNGNNVGEQSSALGLFHELGHGYNWISDRGAYNGRVNTPVRHYDNKEEWFVINFYESPAAKVLGETPRTNHDGALMHTTGPTSTTDVDQQFP